jgi:hypothetical protein
MLGLILDAAVLVGLVMFLNDDNESPGFGKAVAAALAIGLGSFGAMLGLASLGTIVALALILPAAALVAALVLWLAFDVPPIRAALGGGMFLAYKIALVVAFSMIFAT